MNKISYTERDRQSLILYAIKHGAAKAAVKYHTDRQYVYRWLRRYDGSFESLRDKSRRPRRRPNEHTEEELSLIRKTAQQNRHASLILFHAQLCPEVNVRLAADMLLPEALPL